MANVSHVKKLIDEASFGPYQLRVTILCILIAVVDGCDLVLLGVVAPPLMADLAITEKQFGLIIVFSVLAATVGALFVGRLADAVGRRPVIIGSLVLITIFTFLTAYADTFWSMSVVRIFASLSLAGAMPATMSLASETVPQRHSNVVIALVSAGFPLGSAIGSYFGSLAADYQSWHVAFYGGGVLALVMLLVTTFWLPESARFLASKEIGGNKLRRMLLQISPGADQKSSFDRNLDGKSFQAGQSGLSESPLSSFRVLFEDGRATLTLTIWALLFCCGTLTAASLIWIPTLFAKEGMTLAYAGAVVSAASIGGMLGMPTAGKVIDLMGPKQMMCAAYVLAAAALALLGFVGNLAISISAGSVVGFTLGIVTAGGYALAARSYPTLARSTGVGSGAAALRAGTIVAPIVIPIMLGFSMSLSSIFLCFSAAALLGAVVSLGLKSHSEIDVDESDVLKFP